MGQLPVYTKLNIGIASYCALNHTLVPSCDTQFNECKSPISERDASKQAIVEFLSPKKKAWVDNEKRQDITVDLASLTDKGSRLSFT